MDTDKAIENILSESEERSCHNYPPAYFYARNGKAIYINSTDMVLVSRLRLLPYYLKCDILDLSADEVELFINERDEMQYKEIEKWVFGKPRDRDTGDRVFLKRDELFEFIGLESSYQTIIRKIKNRRLSAEEIKLLLDYFQSDELYLES